MNLAYLHRFCVDGLVACGDAADHPDHPDAIVGIAFRRLAYAGMLLDAGIGHDPVSALAEWDLHEAVMVALDKPYPDLTCACCRLRFSQFLENQRTQEEARLERIATLLAP